MSEYEHEGGYIPYGGHTYYGEIGRALYHERRAHDELVHARNRIKLHRRMLDASLVLYGVAIGWAIAQLV